MSSQRAGIVNQGGRASALSGAQKTNITNLKMTQQHLSQGLKQFASMINDPKGGISTTASTTGVNLNQFQSGKSMKSRKQLANQHKRKQSTTIHQDPQLIPQNMQQFVNYEPLIQSKF